MRIETIERWQTLGLRLYNWDHQAGGDKWKDKGSCGWENQLSITEDYM